LIGEKMIFLMIVTVVVELLAGNLIREELTVLSYVLTVFSSARSSKKTGKRTTTPKWVWDDGGCCCCCS
jgi:hypothetical protein